MYPQENQGTKIFVKIPVPKQTSSISVEFEKGSSSSYEYNSQGKYVLWDVGNLAGQMEQTMKIVISLNEALIGDIKKHVGPISMSFEIPSTNISDLRIRYLKVRERSKTYNRKI